MNEEMRSESLDTIMERVTAPELLDCIRELLDEVESRFIRMVAETEEFKGEIE